MKHYSILVLAFLSLGIVSARPVPEGAPESHLKNNQRMMQDSVLRHVVLLKFKEGTSSAQIEEIQQAFAALQGKIPQIQSYEWGLNNSPENLNKDFTHCFLLTFKSEEDRAVYLPHPDHQAFGALAGPHIADVLVVDYWTL